MKNQANCMMVANDPGSNPYQRLPSVNVNIGEVFIMLVAKNFNTIRSGHV